MKATPAGARLDRFELIAELASGGMATVYLARLSGVAGFQRFVAIKRLHPHLSREQEFVDMFLDEARLAARIHNPNVVPILEIGESDQGYYLVMEYIEGDTAARLLARAAQSAQLGGRVPPAVALRIVLDSLNGLHAAHELLDDQRRPLEIVHRDVSPQNILVGVDGVSRITDFGVARAASRLSTTKSGQLKGKLAYMAPEQARGVDLDRRADVFAMGVVMWEMLAGRRLFKGEGEAETLSRVLFEPIPALRSFDPSTPQALEDICLRALERDRAKRFATAADMADTLERAARAMHCLASFRDVAAYVDAVIGQDISQQRDAVRAWLARSEPSRNEGVAVPSGPTAAETGSHPFLLRPALTPGGAVSSVSSAVIQVPEDPTAIAATDSLLPPVPNESGGSVTQELVAPRRRISPWVWAAPVAAAALLLVAWLYPRGAAVPPSAAPVAASPVTEPREDPSKASAVPPRAAAADRPGTVQEDAAEPAAPPTPQPTSPPTAEPAVAGNPPRGSVVAPRPAPARPGGRGKTPTPPAAGQGAPGAGRPAAAAPADEPDDIAHNPYR